MTDQLRPCPFLPVRQRTHHRALGCRVLYHRDDRCALLERNEHRWQLVDRRVLCRQRRASTPVSREKQEGLTINGIGRLNLPLNGMD